MYFLILIYRTNESIPSPLNVSSPGNQRIPVQAPAPLLLPQPAGRKLIS